MQVCNYGTNVCVIDSTDREDSRVYLPIVTGIIHLSLQAPPPMPRAEVKKGEPNKG